MKMQMFSLANAGEFVARIEYAQAKLETEF